MSVLKMAIIGCGRIAGHHCESIQNTVGAELLAVCDLDDIKAKNYEKKYGTKAFRNYHEMFENNPEINCVTIATPSGMHYQHAKEIILRYKKNIIIEKPTFMLPSQVVEIYKIADEANINIFPVFQNRNNLAVQRVLRGLQESELGQVRSLAIRVRWCRPQRYYDLAPWRGTYSMDGGCLTNQGIHHLDILRLLGGEVRRVISIHKTLGADIEVEDTVSGIVEFMSGAIGSLEVTTAARPVDYEASLSVVGDAGLAQIGGIAVNELQIYTPEPGACLKYSEDFSGNVYGNGHSKMYEDIVKEFIGDRPYSIGFNDVHSTIQLLNAFYISDERSAWVEVDGAGDSFRLAQRNKDLEKLYTTAM
jgi:UDP-N-acetyl-2-amino-2-deoxyglucuronate dehydrogenase